MLLGKLGTRLDRAANAHFCYFGGVGDYSPVTGLQNESCSFLQPIYRRGRRDTVGFERAHAPLGTAPFRQLDSAQKGRYALGLPLPGPARL